MTDEPTPDQVVEFSNGHKLVLPGAVVDAANRVENFLVLESNNGERVALLFVTDDPTVETIASQGAERVVDRVLMMDIPMFLDFADNMARHATRLRER